MSQDARFEDGGEAPLRLSAIDAEDLKVISTLIQDAIFPVTEMSWRPSKRQFALLLNRFRWEDATAAERRGRDFERVQAVLQVSDVKSVATQGVDRRDQDVILSILTAEFHPDEDGQGQLLLNLAGDGAIRLDVEALNVILQDVTRPYRAPSGKAPHHAP